MHHHDQIISDLRSRADAYAGVAVPWEDLAIIHKCSVDRLKRTCLSWLALILLTHLDVAELFFSLSFSDKQQAHAPNFIHLISLEVQRACVPSCPFEYNFTAALSNRFRNGRGTRFAAVGIQSAETSQIMSTARDTQSLFFAWQFFTHAWAAKFIRNRERERPNRTGEKMQCDHLQSVWGGHPASWIVEVNLFCFSLFTLQRGKFCHPKHTDASQSQVAGSCNKVYRY